LADLFEGFDLCVIHDGFHPAIMNRNRASSVSFHVRNTLTVQYHFILEETVPVRTSRLTLVREPFFRIGK
jgi:hypothetical protein